MVENTKWLVIKLDMFAIIDKMADVSILTEMAETTNMAQITKLVFWPKFLEMVDIAGVWKLLVRKFAVIREIAKVTQTK